jgi:hypothetical protein
MKVNLHIERLVLEGFPLDGRDAALVQEAMRAELVRLFEQAAGSTITLNSKVAPASCEAAMRASETSSPSTLGGAIANSIYGAISK